jgi:hypothetical protein
LTHIGTGAFYGCNALTSITFPSSLTHIGESAFWGCRGLTSITFPSSLTHIGDEAFWGCNGLTSVTFSESLTDVDNSAFDECMDLKRIIMPYKMYKVKRDFSFLKKKSSMTMHKWQRLPEEMIPTSVKEQLLLVREIGELRNLPLEIVESIFNQTEPYILLEMV